MEANQFVVKHIWFLSRMVPILCQNENGPCPLLAIVNTMLLLGELKLHEDIEYVSEAWLMSAVADSILARTQLPPEGHPNRDNANALLTEALDLLPRLMGGLDVNVGFQGPHAFEFTNELSLFDLVDVRLVHGWLPDAQLEPDVVAALRGLTYNTAVEKAVTAGLASPERQGGAGAGAAAAASGDSGSGVWPAASSPPHAARASTHSAFGLEEASSSGAAAVPLSGAPSAPHSPAPALTPLRPSALGIRVEASRHRLEASEGTGLTAGGSMEPLLLDVGVASPVPASPIPAASPVLSPLAATDVVLPAASPALGPATSPALAPALAPAAAEEPRGVIIADWLRKNGTQLTAAGIEAIRAHMRDCELSILYRNHHFSVIFKWQGGLYLLVTDQGYARIPTVVWEALHDVMGGRNEFVDAEFRPITARADATAGSAGGYGGESKRESGGGGGSGSGVATVALLPDEHAGPHAEESDRQLAERLQQEEEAAAAARQRGAGIGGGATTVALPQRQESPAALTAILPPGVQLPEDFGDLDEEERRQVITALAASQPQAPHGSNATGAATGAANSAGPRASTSSTAAAAVPGGRVPGRNDKYGQAASNLRAAAIERERRRVAAEAQAGGQLHGVEGLSDAEIAMRLQQQEIERQRRVEANAARRTQDSDEDEGGSGGGKPSCSVM